MADEIVNDVQDTPNDNQPAPVESRARELGWIPKEEYHGDDAQWLSAEEFVRRQPLFEKIDKQNRELKEIKRTMAKFADHHSKVREAEYARAIDELKAQKIAAFEEGDAKAIVKIDDEIRVVEKAQDQFQAEQVAQVKQEAAEIHPEFEAWTNRNSWYATNKIMKAAADVIGSEVANSYKPDGSKYSPAEVLKEVEKRIKVEFPKNFSNPNREKPGAVEGASSKGSSKESGYVPSPSENAIAEKFVRQGLFKSKEDYFKELKLLNGKS